MAKITFEQARSWAISKLAKMTLEEKCDYVSGTNGFYTKALPRLKIPSVLFSDATAGVVLRDRFLEATYQNALPRSTAFPAPIALAATWNRDLAESFARAIGEQCAGNGIGVLLGPGFNLYRVSQCGRNFEYFGEDPYLVSELVRRYVRGVQSTGTIATLKHFVANNTDYFRRKSNSILDERTLHETYTRAFKAGIEEGAMAVMTAYNLVNGEWASQSQYLIKHWLREVLGFKWLVMSDWWAVYDCKKLVESGQDLEMPAGDVTGNLLARVRSGEIDEADVDRMVTSILTTLKAMELFDLKPSTVTSDDFFRHESVALQTARESMVLLRNQNNILPLKPDSKILALGEDMVRRVAGGGSSFVKGYEAIDQYDALINEFKNIEYNPHPSDDEIQTAELILLSIGTRDSESFDRPFELDRNERRYLDRVLSLNSNVIVLVNSGSGIQMADWIEKTMAIIYCWYSGQNGSVALAEILSGKTNPSGKLPFTLERDFSDGPGASYIPEGEVLYLGENDAWEAARDVYDVPYDEGVFMGYRWYEKKQIKPLFAFGFGLSYTTFIYNNLNLSQETLHPGETLVVKFEITNSGEVDGAEIAQLYIRNPPTAEPRPLKELKGFCKLDIEPGKTQQATLMLSFSDFAYWSPDKADWCVPSGEYEIVICSASDVVELSAKVNIPE